MKRIFFAAAIAALSAVSMSAHAQCCGAGNPISVSNTDNSLRKSHLQIALDYRHSASDTYYEGSRKSDYDFIGRIDNSSYDFMNLGVAYGITSRWTVQAQLGYYISKKEDFRNEMLPDASISGLGDLSLSASYVAYRNLRKGIELVPFAMMKFPVGKFDCENDGIKLPISMQPSSGSYKYSAGAYFYANLSRRWYVTSYDLYEYAQRIRSNNFDYQYGGLVYLNAAAYYKAFDFFTAGVNVSYEHMGRAKSDGAELFGTSYHSLRISPQLQFRPCRQIYLIGSVELPVWRNVEGLQMSGKWAMQFRVVYDISLM